MAIERVTTSYYRIPIEPSADAGHGLLDHEELILVEVMADEPGTGLRFDRQALARAAGG